jgi:hypothetical protein
MLLSTRLINHCERFFGHAKAADKRLINDAFFIVPFEKDGDEIQFELTAETFVTSRKPLAKVDVKSQTKIEIPDIFPLKPTVSLSHANFYADENAYPVKAGNQFAHPHTILLHYSNLDVKNLFETPVTSDQFESRAIFKGFAAAASRAQSLYGSEVGDLETPIAIQVVQIDSRRIQFGIFQLNTLNLNSANEKKNFWFRKPEMLLYEDCCYKEGRPSLTSYNFDVFKMMSVFYSS